MVTIVKTGAPDCARIYDLGIKTWLTDNIIFTEKVIPNVFASPEKVFGEMSRLQGIGKKLRPILPFISITRVLSVKDPSKYNIVDMNGIAYVDDTLQDRIYSTNYPVPVNIGYQFDVWMNFIDDKNKIETQFQLSFNHPVYVNFTIDDKINDKICHFTLTSVNDTSSLEPVAAENRIFRNTYNCNLEAMMYYGYFEERTIGTSEIDVYVANTQAATMDPIVDADWTLEGILLGTP